MMKRCLILSFILLIVSCGVAFSGRSISLPFTETFDNNAWLSDLPYTSEGAVASHVTDNCYSGGCAKITPPTGTQGYWGLGQFTGFNTTRLNIRFLHRIGSTLTNASTGWNGNKLVIVIRSGTEGDGARRGMLMQHSYLDENWEAAICLNIDCDYDVTPVYNFADWENQWVCFEYELDTSTGSSKLYITTQDNTWNETLYDTESVGTGDAWVTIDVIGGFGSDEGRPADANAYQLFDSIVISNTYIGPPAGFNGSSSSSVTLLTPIDNAVADWPVDFNWTGLDNTIYYHIQVDNNANFASPEIDNDAVDPDGFCDAENDCHYLVEYGEELHPGTHYYWRVRALR